VVKIAKIKAPQLLAPDTKQAVKELLGTCVSIGVTVEGKDPREVQSEIDSGDHDNLFA